VSRRARRWLGCALAVSSWLALASCSTRDGCASGGEPGGGAAPRPLATLANDPGPLDALTRRFARLRDRLRERGGTQASGPARWFVLEGEGVSAPLDLPTDRCTTFVALGGGGLRDLRLALYDGEGTELAADAVPGEGALVHVCPGAEATAGMSGHAPHHLVATSAEGAGALLVAGFTAPAGTRLRFDGLFDGLLAPRVESAALEARLAVAREPLRARGFVQQGATTVGTLAEGEGLQRTEPLDVEHCYAVVAAASDGLADVDLFVYDAQGAEIARDIGQDAAPALEVCPLEGGPHTVEVRAFSGAGGVALAVLSGPATLRGAPADGTAGGPGDDAARGDPGTEAAVDPVAALQPVLAALASRGYGEAVLAVRDGVIAPGEERVHELNAPAGCAVVIVAGGGRGADLDLYLADASGRELERDTSVQPIARASVCRAAAGVLRATVKAYGLDGRYALAMVPAPRAITTDNALRLDEARAPLVARGYRVTQSSEVALAEGERRALPLSIAAGTCLAIAAAGDSSLRDVDLFLRDADGRLLASESGPAAYASVSRCAQAEEDLVIEVVAYQGAGTVTVEQLAGAP
jgi:hypothetical protein